MSDMVKFDYSTVSKFIKADEIAGIKPGILARKCWSRQLGNDFLGWVDLPKIMIKKSLPE